MPGKKVSARKKVVKPPYQDLVKDVFDGFRLSVWLVSIPESAQTYRIVTPLKWIFYLYRLEGYGLVMRYANYSLGTMPVQIGSAVELMGYLTGEWGFEQGYNPAGVDVFEGEYNVIRRLF